MITGAHVVIYSTDPEADRAFFRDVLKFPHVDVGGGWLIFGLPPSEAALHPADANGRHRSVTSSGTASAWPAKPIPDFLICERPVSTAFLHRIRVTPVCETHPEKFGFAAGVWNTLKILRVGIEHAC